MVFFQTRYGLLRVALLALLALTPAVWGGEVSEQELTGIIEKYVDASQTQHTALRGVQMEVDIDASVPKLHKHATMRALRSISRLGQVTYKALGFSGDTSVRKEIITRYLSAETEGRESGAMAITPANYKFKLKQRTELDGRPADVLQLIPRKKAVGLFKGELWVDAQTGMPLRESGQFVKSPSVFLKKILFVRDYELQDGVAVPKHIASTVHTRIIGKAEIQIQYSNFAREREAVEAAALDTSSASISGIGAQ